MKTILLFVFIATASYTFCQEKKCGYVTISEWPTFGSKWKNIIITGEVKQLGNFIKDKWFSKCEFALTGEDLIKPIPCTSDKISIKFVNPGELIRFYREHRAENSEAETNTKLKTKQLRKTGSELEICISTSGVISISLTRGSNSIQLNSTGNVSLSSKVGNVEQKVDLY